jgi:hypothetical protein
MLGPRAEEQHVSTTTPWRGGWLAWLAFGMVASVGAWGVIDSLRHAGDDHAWSVLATVSWRLIPVVFTGLGAFVVHRRPDNAIGWLLMAPGLAVADMSGSLATGPPVEVTVWLMLQVWYDNLSWLLLIFPIVLMLALFPTGQPISGRWWWHTWTVLGMGALLVTWVLFGETLEPVDQSWQVENPIGFLPGASSASLDWFMPFWSAGLITVTVGALASMVVRFRRADAVERQQIEWLLYAVAMFALAYISAALVNEWVEASVIDILLIPTLLFIPVSVTIAIVRYQAFDIHVIVRRTIVYTMLTGLLAAVYLVSVVAFGSVVGQVADTDSSLSVAASTLLVAALFNPLRARTRGFVEGRFFRRPYDAQRILADFGLTSRDQIDVDQLTGELVETVATALHPASTTLWIPDQPRHE